MLGFLIASAAVGATAGGISYLSSVHTQEQALSRQIDNLKAQKEDALDTLDLNFKVAKDEATKSADKSDQQQTLNEGFVSEDINNQIGALQANEEAQGLANNTAAMQIGSAKGDSLSQMATSGTRNSSQAQAVEMQDAVNSAQLEASEKQARANDDYSLYQVLNSLATNVATIQSNRTDALDLRKSYDDGSVYGTAGNQYTLYQDNRKKTANSYDRAIKEARDARDEMLDKGNMFLGTITSMFGGASSGLSFYNSLSSAINNASSTYQSAANTSYNTSTNTSAVSLSYNKSTNWNYLG